MNKYLIVRFTRLYLVLLILGAVFYSLILKELFPFIVGEQYSTSAEIIFPVALSYVVFGAYQIFFPYLIHSKKTDILILISPLSALLNVVLNFLWIPKFGMVAAAYATIAAYSLSAILVFLFTLKFYPMPWFSKYKLE